MFTVEMVRPSDLDFYRGRSRPVPSQHIYFERDLFEKNLEDPRLVSRKERIVRSPEPTKEFERR